MASSNGYQNGHARSAPSPAPKGVPVPAHDLTSASTGQYSQNGYTTYYGANPGPGWSQHVGPQHKAPPAVATQLVVPTDLSDGPVTLTCFNCQHHVPTRTKSGPSTLTWALCACMCIFLCVPCCLIPFCCPPLNVTEHYCTNCGTLLGKHKGWKK